jgi:hypothetical protein
VSLRPQSPPSVVFGDGTDLATDPTLRFKMSQLEMDFYVFSLDRSAVAPGAAAVPAAGGACAVAGSTRAPGAGLVLLALGFGALAARARRRSRRRRPLPRAARSVLGTFAGVLLVASVAVAGCGGAAVGVGPDAGGDAARDDGGAPADGAPADGGGDRDAGSDGALADSGADAAPDAALADGGPDGAVADGGALDGGALDGGGDGAVADGAAPGDAAPDAGPPPPALQPGLIGAYTSAVVTAGQIWVAGYSEADPAGGLSYGDLVAGTWSGTAVGWAQVDGVPAAPPPDPTLHDVTGFRGGQTAPGDDVGLYTSIAVDGAGQPVIAYYDRTHRALKLARRAGGVWSAHTVAGGAGDHGRHAKLLPHAGGFVIAYLAIVAGGTDGALISKVRLATSATEAPQASDWQFTDVVVDTRTPCRADLCGSGEACVASGRCLAIQPDCSPACASGSACVDLGAGPVCSALVASLPPAYPSVVGASISLAAGPQDELGVAYHDRLHGDLGLARRSAGVWSVTVAAGVSAGGGDVGLGAALAIDAAGDWHVVYGDAPHHRLRYLPVAGGTTLGAPALIDDGVGLAGIPFADGPHWVGDDPHVAALADGTIHVSYQDATVGVLRHAVGSPGAGALTWEVSAVPQADFAGAFSRVLVVGGEVRLMSWWRHAGARGDVRILAP